ncbi:hypothetical protein C8R43DRAFT_1200840 [Mycena crocata]|nr:hypothetical protein C8R43DRAFT_1200840 [Mycena crocata]
MLFKTSLMSAVSAATLIGTAYAFNGTANLGFIGTTNCGCPTFNGPYAAAVPAELVGSARCCNVAITVTYLDKTVEAVFSGIYDAGAGTENVALSPRAFADLAGFPEETALAPVTWSFK